jgi:hypothetical protein
MKTVEQLIKHKYHVYRAYKFVSRQGLELFASPALKMAIDKHDNDKTIAGMKGDQRSYDLHDAHNEHHAAYWIIHGKIEDVWFAEHIIDHIAVQIDRKQDQALELSQMLDGLPFSRGRSSVSLNGEAFDDAIIAIKDYDETLRRFKIAQNLYNRMVDKYLPILNVLSEVKVEEILKFKE